MTVKSYLIFRFAASNYFGVYEVRFMISSVIGYEWPFVGINQVIRELRKSSSNIFFIKGHCPNSLLKFFKFT